MSRKERILKKTKNKKDSFFFFFFGNPSSAPWPDGYGGYKIFFPPPPKITDIVRDYVVNTIRQFFISGYISLNLISFFICLIPKAKQAIQLACFCLNAIGNSLFRNITKVLVSILGEVAN